jgi:hypothetical protein
MRKLTTAIVLVLAFMFALTMFQTITYAAEGDDPLVITDPEVDPLLDLESDETWFDNLVAAFQDWGSFKNFALSLTGISILTSIWRINRFRKRLKTKEGKESVYSFAEKLLGRLVDKPELVMSILAMASKFPIIQELITSFKLQARRTDKVIQAEILKLTNKINLGVFEEGAELNTAVALLADLRRDDEKDTNTG